MRKEQAFAVPLARHIDDASLDGARRRPEAHGGAVERHAPARGRQTEDGANHVGLAVALNAAQSEDFASPGAKRDILEETVRRQILDTRRPPPRRKPERIGQRHFAAHHRGDKALMADCVAFDRADDFAVLEHCNAIGDREDFRQSMRDEYDRRSPPA